MWVISRKQPAVLWSGGNCPVWCSWLLEDRQLSCQACICIALHEYETQIPTWQTRVMLLGTSLLLCLCVCVCVSAAGAFVWRSACKSCRDWRGLVSVCVVCQTESWSVTCQLFRWGWIASSVVYCWLTCRPEKNILLSDCLHDDLWEWHSLSVAYFRITLQVITECAQCSLKWNLYFSYYLVNLLNIFASNTLIYNFHV